MKIFVTGVNGQLGYDTFHRSMELNHEAVASDIQCGESASYVSLDITDRIAVMNTIQKLRPDAVIHCAAWTKVDDAEDLNVQSDVDAINHLGTRYLAEAAKTVDAKMVYISTDYVFNGQGTAPWKPDDDCYAPLNVYGRSKLDGEIAVSSVLQKFFIVRTSWVFGRNGNNFVKAIAKAGRTHDSVRVVNDQIGRPTYTKDLARLLVDLVESDKYGRYHATNEGSYISWYDFTKEIYRQIGITAKVIPVSTAEYGLSKARRPFNSRLDTSKLAENGFTPLPDWKDALSDYLAEAQLSYAD